MRRRSKVDDPVEYFSNLRASHSIDRADVVVDMTDGSEGVTVQDVRIMDHVLEWELIHRDEEGMHRLFERSQFATGASRIIYEEQGINLFA